MKRPTVSEQNKKEEIGICTYLLIGLSYALFILTLPVSLFVSLKVNQFDLINQLDLFHYIFAKSNSTDSQRI